MKSLAEFKRYLAKPNSKIRMSELYWQGVPQDVFFKDWRGVRKLQSTQVQLENGSWLTFGKASEWEFDGSKAIVDSDGIKIVYEIGEDNA